MTPEETNVNMEQNVNPEPENTAAEAPLTEVTPEVTAEVTPEVTPDCLLYTSPSPRDRQKSRMPSSA